MKLYVGNLSFNTNESALKAAFERCGTVTDVKIMQDRETGRSRGFGFVTMSTRSEGEAAASTLNGANLDGRKLTVNEARPQEERSQRPQRSFAGSRRS